MKIKTKELTAIALLTALSILLPQIFPPIMMPPFTATFASHVPIIISMFISPVAALFAAIGSAIAFAIKLGDPFVTARAASHVIFAVAGALMLRKKWNYILVLLITMLIHAIGETFVAVPLISWAFPALSYTGTAYVVFVGTMIHHAMDSVISVVILIPLIYAGLVTYDGIIKTKLR